jgi:hypothetical protein
MSYRQRETGIVINAREDLVHLKANYKKEPQSVQVYRAYKYLKKEHGGQWSPVADRKINYSMNQVVTVPKNKCDYDECNDCGAGINLATRDWVLREAGLYIMETGKPAINSCYVIRQFEFRICDIVCMPIDSNGKFRVRRATMVPFLSYVPSVR